MHQVQLGPQEGGHTPVATQLHRLIPPLQNYEEGRWPNSQEKTPQWDGLGHKGNIPDQGTGAGQGGTKVPHQNAKGNPSHPP